MPWDVRPEGCRDPARDVAELRLRVVVAGDHERRELQPDAGPGVCLDRLENGCQCGAAQAAVEAVVEGLEIHVGCVEDRREKVDGFGGRIAVGDEQVAQARLPGRAARSRARTRGRRSAPRRCRRSTKPLRPVPPPPVGRGPAAARGCPARGGAPARSPSSGRSHSGTGSPRSPPRMRASPGRRGKAASSRSDRPTPPPPHRTPGTRAYRRGSRGPRRSRDDRA